MVTIHFICRGNANRSFMAEAYLKSLKLDNVGVLSSGCVADIYRAENEPRMPHILSLLDKHDVSQFAKKQPEQLTQQRIDKCDVTVCMNQRVADESRESYVLPSNTFVWDVDDVGEGKRTLVSGENPYKYAEEIYQQIVSNVDVLLQQLALQPEPAQR
jgi:protein-tyrosine-phosphatase